MPNPSRPILHEFFAGGGLAGMGLDGFETAFANDIDPVKAATWRANHPHPERMVEGDVWGLSAADLPGRPDVAWASSPCQDVSLAGRRGGLAAPRSGAFWGFWRLIEALDGEGRAPRAVVLENVMGLLSSNGGEDFRAVCEAMTGLGYRIGALEIDAAGWVPQSRPRLFLIAARDPDWPTGASGLFQTPRIRTAFEALPSPVKSNWIWWPMQAPPRRNADLAAALIPDSQANWMGAVEAERLLAMMAPLHRARLDAALATGERRVGAAYRRVRTEQGRKVQRLEARFDGLAGCLRTPAGGSSRQYVIVCEGGRARVRLLTGREAARLMGAPERFILPRSQTQAIRLMGDAVAVPVARAIGEQILAPLLARVGMAA